MYSRNSHQNVRDRFTHGDAVPPGSERRLRGRVLVYDCDVHARAPHHLVAGNLRVEGERVLVKCDDLETVTSSGAGHNQIAGLIPGRVAHA